MASGASARRLEQMELQFEEFDGMIAWFEGDSRKANAWRAVQDILLALDALDLPRQVGLGLHDGEVVEAAIGAGERSDATILGRTMNVTARLCAAAAGGEVLVSETVLPQPADVQLEQGAFEEFELKGHRDKVSAQRFRPH